MTVRSNSTPQNDRTRDVSPIRGRKLSDLTPAELEKLAGFFGALLTDLKTTWEAQPENQGKTVTYAELWKGYVEETQNFARVKPPDDQRLTGTATDAPPTPPPFSKDTNKEYCMSKQSYKVAETAKQGAYRRTGEELSDKARKPTDAVGSRHPHLLAAGFELENLNPSIRKQAITFFADRKIHWWRSSATGDDVQKDIPTRNLLSSQIACLNYLLPLVGQSAALTAFLRAIDPEVSRAVTISYEQNGRSFKSDVEFEWTGFTGNIEGTAQSRGANATSVDAFLLAELKDGSTRAYLIEWKYTEHYQVGESKGEGRSGDTRRRRYAHLIQAEDSSFRSGINLDDLLYDPIYQIMRMFLLRDRMLREEHQKGITSAKVVVICPEDNVDYRNRITSPALIAKLGETSTLEEAIRSLLKNPDDFIEAAPEKIASEMRRSLGAKVPEAWDAYLQSRYGW